MTMILHSGNLVLLTFLAWNWPQPANGDAAHPILCSQPTLCFRSSQLELEITCSLHVALHYDKCLWEKNNSDGKSETVGVKKVLHHNNYNSNKINNECSLSVPLLEHVKSPTSSATPPITVDVYFEYFEHSSITRNRKVFLDLPDVAESQCRLQRPLWEKAPETLTCKLLTFIGTFQQTYRRLEEEMCTSAVQDSDKFFPGMSSDLGKKLVCYQGDTEIESHFDVDMEYVGSLARVTISASGLEDIRVGQKFTRGSKWFRFVLSFRHPGRGVAIRFLLQRPKQGPLLVECTQVFNDCQAPAAIHSRRTRRTTHSARPTTTTSPDTTTSRAQMQKLSDANADTKTRAVTIVAAVLGGVLIVVLVTIVVVAVLVRRKKLKKKRESRPSMCRFLSHEEDKTDMFENFLYAERRQLHGSCEMIQNDIYRSQENLCEMIQNDIYRSQENLCDDNPEAAMRGDYFLTEKENSNTSTDTCVTGNSGADDGIVPADDTPSEAMIYSTIDSTSADNT